MQIHARCLALLVLLRIALGGMESHAKLVALPGSAELGPDALAIVLPIGNEGSAPAEEVELQSISLAGASLVEPAGLPNALGNIGAHGRKTLRARFTGDAFGPGGACLVRIAGTFAEQGHRLPFALEWPLRIPPASPGAGKSAASSSSASTVSGGRYPHQAPNFPETVNGSPAHAVPNGSEPAAAELAPVEIGGLWGYTDRAGVVRIQPKFAGAAAFRNGYARVMMGNQYGLINAAGAFVLQPVFDGLDEVVSEGLAAACKGKCGPNSNDARWGFVDVRTGKAVIPASFTAARAFSEGLAAVCVGRCYPGGKSAGEPDGKWGFIDASGAFRIAAQFEEAGSFRNGVARVAVGRGAEKRSGFIDAAGKFVTGLSR